VSNFNHPVQSHKIYGQTGRPATKTAAAATRKGVYTQVSLTFRFCWAFDDKKKKERKKKGIYFYLKKKRKRSSKSGRLSASCSLPARFSFWLGGERNFFKKKKKKENKNKRGEVLSHYKERKR
jgi:hypothetical protein